jgi:hypothetical protein
MEEYFRLFFEGEALQQVVACFCNAGQRRTAYANQHIQDTSSTSASGRNHTRMANALFGTQNTVLSKILCTMIQSGICMRMTCVGLAPMVADITMVLPYSQMTRLQVEYLQDILSRATFNPCPNTADPIKAIAYGNEVVVITTLHSQRIWQCNASERPALYHTFANGLHTAKSGPKNSFMCTHDVQSDRGKKAISLQKTASMIQGMGNSCDIPNCNAQKAPTASKLASSCTRGRSMQPTTVYIEETEILKAFCACVFRSKVHQDNALREGICNVILQMVIGEVGTTKDVLRDVHEFVKAAKEISS